MYTAKKDTVGLDEAYDYFQENCLYDSWCVKEEYGYEEAFGYVNEQINDVLIHLTNRKLYAIISTENSTGGARYVSCELYNIKR